MQERLAVFKELNVIRTVARVIYSTAFVSTGHSLSEASQRSSIWHQGTARLALTRTQIMIAADLLSKEHRIITSRFATSFVAVHPLIPSALLGECADIWIGRRTSGHHCRLWSLGHCQSTVPPPCLYSTWSR